jgi:hypothetical protein
MCSRTHESSGAVAKWQGKGLQNPHRRFDSAPRLQFTETWNSAVVTMTPLVLACLLYQLRCRRRQAWLIVISIGHYLIGRCPEDRLVPSGFEVALFRGRASSNSERTRAPVLGFAILSLAHIWRADSSKIQADIQLSGES